MLLAWNESQPLNPASIMKLVTTDVALEMLGPTFTWKTRAYAAGTLQGDVLQGDLVIKGGGDPKLVFEHLWLFLRRIRDRGIRDRVHEVVLRGAEQSVSGGDDRVTTGPHRHRGEAERDGQGDARTDEPAADAEEGAAGYGHVGAGAGPDDRRGQDGQGADGDADGH